MYESKDVMVSHPAHYQSETGNVLKYMCRWKNKNGVQDLEKARWYLEHLIDHVKSLEEENK